MAAKRVNIFLDERLHTDAKIASVLHKRTLSRFLSMAIEEAVQRDSRQIRDLLE